MVGPCQQVWLLGCIKSNHALHTAGCCRGDWDGEGVMSGYSSYPSSRIRLFHSLSSYSFSTEDSWSCFTKWKFSAQTGGVGIEHPSPSIPCLHSLPQRVRATRARNKLYSITFSSASTFLFFFFFPFFKRCEEGCFSFSRLSSFYLLATDCLGNNKILIQDPLHNPITTWKKPLPSSMIQMFKHVCLS